MTNNRMRAMPKRLPAEWEPQGAILLSWPHAGTDWRDMLSDVKACFIDIANAIVGRAHTRLIVVAPDCDDVRNDLAALPQDMITYLDVPTNDTWARDFGAVTCVTADGEAVLCDFVFNGWGMKFAACHDNMITRRMAQSHVFAGRYEPHLDFVLEGGSIDSDGCGTLLTTSTCLLAPNRNDAMSKEQIESYMLSALGAQRVLWLDHGRLAGDDTDGHVDTLARLAPGDTIYYVGCQDPADEHYTDLQAMRHELAEMRTAAGNRYNLIELPLPDAIYDEDGERLPATYANYLPLNGCVLLPVYGQERNDRLAAQLLKVAYHDCEIVPVDCRPLIRQHGSLHCVTMQFPPCAVNIPTDRH